MDKIREKIEDLIWEFSNSSVWFQMIVVISLIIIITVVLYLIIGDTSSVNTHSSVIPLHTLHRVVHHF